MTPIHLGRVLLVCASLLCAGGSLLAQSRSGPASRTIQAGGMERSYLIHLPESHRPGQTLPLLVVLHGAGGDGPGMAEHTGLTEAATRRGYAVVYPNGVARRWNDGRVSSPQDDVGFIRLLLDSLGRELPVDTGRVYATGISNGAGLAYRLACELPATFAAIAPVAGAPAAGLEEHCAATRPISLISFQGTRDPLMPYGGGDASSGRGRVLGAAQSAALFARVNGCAPSPTIGVEPDTVRDGTGVRRTVYTGCSGGREVVLYTIEGGGHTWPGGPPVGRRVGRVSRDVDATRALLDFFDRHPTP